MTIVTGLFGLITGIITTYMKCKNSNNCNLKNLTQHPFFFRIDILSNEIVSSLTLHNKGKEKVFKDIIYNQMKIFKESLTNLSLEVDSKKIRTDNDLYTLNLKHYNQIFEKLNSYYLLENYTDDEKKVLSIVMKKYMLWGKERNKSIIDNISQICNSPFYNSIETKTAVILDIYMAIAIDTINDAERTLSNINGDLRGLIYKGTKI